MKKIVLALIAIALLFAGLIAFLLIYKDGELARKTFHWLERRATFNRRFEEAVRGVDYCQWLIGEDYAYGNYVSKNPEEAVRWFRYSAEQGNRDGQLLLANALLGGFGVMKNEVEALMWLNLVASESAGMHSGEMDRQYRDSVAAKLSPGDVKAARELALRWRKKSWAELKDF